MTIEKRGRERKREGERARFKLREQRVKMMEAGDYGSVGGGKSEETWRRQLRARLFQCTLTPVYVRWQQLRIIAKRSLGVDCLSFFP